MNWWWANVLTAMGAPRSEWERYCNGKGWGRHDLGDYDNHQFKAAHYADGLFDRMSGPLPIIGA